MSDPATARKQRDAHSVSTPGVGGPLRVCFHRPAAYPLFYPQGKGLFGGAEVRAHRFATELSARPEYAVSFVVADEGQLPLDQVGRVTTVPNPCGRFDAYVRRTYESVCRSTPKGFSWRGLLQLPPLLWQVSVLVSHRVLTSLARPRPRQFYRDVGCNLWCCFGLNGETADIVATCVRDGTGAIVFLVNAEEVSDAASRGRGYVPMLGTTGHAAWYALEHASHIVAQTQFQADRIRKRFATPVTVIRNPIELGLRPPLNRATGDFALWIGKAELASADYKRAILLPALARLCPEVPFRAVVNPVDSGSFARLRESCPPNVEIIERVSREEADQLMAKAAVLLNTSISEGFPNVFVEAGKHGVPVLSLCVDPEGMLSRHGGGIVCGDDLETMAKQLRRLWQDPEDRRRLGDAGRLYVEREHDVIACTDQLAQLLRRVAAD